MKVRVHAQVGPRNPLVAPALFRHAGPHGPSRKALRRSAAQQLRKEVLALKPESP